MDMKNKRGTMIKKILLIAILLALAGFFFVQRDCFRDGNKSFSMKDHDTVITETVSILGSHVIEQPIVMTSDMFSYIGILFDNPMRNTAKGSVEIELIDSDGNSVGSTGLEAKNLKENRYTKFLLNKDSNAINANTFAVETNRASRVGRTKVKKGEEYILKITAKNISSDGPLGIVMCKDSAKPGIGDVSMDDKAQKGYCVYMLTKIQKYSKRAITLVVILLLMMLGFVLLPFEWIDNKVSGILKKEDFVLSTWVSRAMFVLTPFATYFIIQKYSRFNLDLFLEQLLDPDTRGLLNLFIIGLLLWTTYTISNSVRFASVTTVLIASLFGLTNHLLILFRDFPLLASDFAQFGTAMQVAGSYTIISSRSLVWAVLLTVLWCVAVCALPGHKGLPLKKRLIPVAILLIWGASFYYLFFVSSYVEDHGIKIDNFKPSSVYNRNGSALSFVITANNTIVDKPKGYSAKDVEDVAKQYQSDRAEAAKKPSRKTPNLIVIMNESFSDEAVLGKFDTNKDYMPFYHSLKENTIKGFLDSSVFGNSTANSEFEFLTGFSMRFMPFHSVPFRSSITESIPTICNDLKAMEYGGIIAFHPGMRSSYNRENVYPLLGFEKHIAVEDLKDPDKIRDFVSDKYSYERVEKEYEDFRKTSDKPFFIFNLTIQNHGGYDTGTGIVDAGIEITSDDSIEDTATQFVNLIKLSDDALKEIVDYYSKVDEETVILLYGDHQPKLGDEFYNYLKGQHKGITDIEWSELQHQVPFMIWANYDIEEKEDVRMSINYLSPYLKTALGLPMTGFDKYLMDTYSKLPIINSLYYMDSQGTLYDPAEKSKYDDVLNEYAKIQYNGFVDSRHRANDLFYLK